jgi:hypothetical protein
VSPPPAIVDAAAPCSDGQAVVRPAAPTLADSPSVSSGRARGAGTRPGDRRRLRATRTHRRSMPPPPRREPPRLPSGHPSWWP